MPAPSNANSMSLGRPVIDTSIIQDQGARICFEKLLETLVGMGSPCGAQAGDDTYQAVYAQNSGSWSLWAGKPTDPLNPDSITGIAGSSSIIAQDNGVTIVAAATTLNFGSGITVTDSGAGVALVDAAGGGGTNAFGTITVTGQSNVEADASPDSVQFAAGTGIVITTDAATDKVTWAISTSAVTTLAFKTIQVLGQTDVVADAPDDTAEFVAGANMTITTSGDAITFASALDGVGYDEIQEEGTPLTKRAKLNLISDRVTATDNAGASRTDVTFEYYIRVYGTTTTAVTAATTTFDVDGVSVIQGDMPELTAGELEITNSAKIPIDDETEAEFRWNQDAGQWQTEPLKCHMVTGLATAAVTGAAFSIDNIELVCGSDPRTDPSSAAETLSVENPFAWDIDNNGSVLAIKKASGDWIAIQATCPA